MNSESSKELGQPETSSDSNAESDDPSRYDDVTLTSRIHPQESEASGNDIQVSQSAEAQDESTAEIPEQVGRYQIEKQLGSGGFGCVYLGHDPKLNRRVAIKMPLSSVSKFHQNCFIEEGRAVARLKHPSIVGIFNIEETDDGTPFVVMEYVEGPTLSKVIVEDGLTFTQTIRYLIQIAEALQYAHGETLIHRDIKPANVIISTPDDIAKLMDFGLAIHDLTPDEQLPTQPEGTPPYMSPEQVRGENHRLDRRTDIWAFGVLMYVMLTGRKPFSGKKISELAESICLHDPKTPRSRNGSVPVELERICLKCIEKLMSNRYQQTSELVDDLKSFQTRWEDQIDEDPSNSSIGIYPTATLTHAGFDSNVNSAPSLPNAANETPLKKVKVVPKGLRSFDSQDSDFFIDLLPGPKDRFGVPESLRFWTNRLARDAEELISVGLIFGPSGCGKSSFVKAGLIPRLTNVKTIYLEATPDDTEQRILQRLELVAPQIVRDERDLDRIFARIRRGQLLTGEKLLVVIDQFEQWLHSHPNLERQPLVQALRQCDGENLSCVLLVRDDFWMSATQFMQQLDLKVQEGVNALGIPLFDRKHARRVLTAYGQANEALGNEITAKQADFIKDAVSEMSDNGRVIPIHLALFSQMMDSDSWDAEQLKRMGGWRGLGVHFLESMFSEKRAMAYEQTCRGILAELLPAAGTRIKGIKKSFRQLLDSSQGQSSDQLKQSLEFLDRDLRIITPTESETDSTEVQNYQLSHDYLVAPVREWLSKKARETRAGRARVRLAELASQWDDKRESRFLPSLFEYANIRTAVSAETCSNEHKEFLQTADRHYLTRSLIVGALLATLILTGFSFWKSLEQKRLVQGFNSLLLGSPGEVRARLELLDSFDSDDVVRLAKIDSSNANTRAKIHAAMVLSKFGAPAEVPLKTLLDNIESADAGECANIIDALRSLLVSPRKEELLRQLADRFTSTDSNVAKSRLAIVAMHLGDASLIKQSLALGFDQEPRAELLEVHRSWQGSEESLVEVLETMAYSEPPSFQSGVCQMVGQLNSDQVSSELLSRIKNALTGRTLKSNHAVVHSSARWAMEELGLELPELSHRMADNPNWLIRTYRCRLRKNIEKLTFVRVDPQTVYHNFGMVGDKIEPTEIELPESFYISAREVSANLFLEFLLSEIPEYPALDDYENQEISSRSGLPMSRIEPNLIFRFCNWLSELDDLDPVYKLRPPKSSEIKTRGFLNYEGALILDGTRLKANGYRIPTSLQWEAACRGGTKTRYWWGKFQRLTRYVISSTHPNLVSTFNVGERGKKLPNAFGIFDMIGNAAELVQNPNESNVDSPVILHSVLGGYAHNHPEYFQSSHSRGVGITTNFPFEAYLGIRLVIQND